MTTEPIVEVHGVTKVYEPSPPWMRVLLKSAIRSPVRALNDVSLAVGPGQVCAVVGPNGAGKSTLFRVLMGLTTPTAGRASILGHDVSTESQQVRALVGYMHENNRSLFLRHTCRQNLIFHGRLQGIPDSELSVRIDDVLERVEIAHARDSAGHALSTGMRARLQLAMALLHRPRVLVLDEPTGSVDPIGAHRLLRLIEGLTDEFGLAVLLSSHRVEEIDALHDNVLFLDRGRVVHWGDLDSLREFWERPRVAIEFKREGAAREAAGLLGKRDGFEIEMASSTSLTATVKGQVGELLVALGPLLGDMVSVNEVKMPLRELLTRLVEEQGTG